jgi:hypothetical protein
MEVFQKLGAEVETLWREKNYDEEVFPEIAENALLEAEIPQKISAWEVAGWTLGQTFLPQQQDLRASFGDPPITLYNSPRFHIDVYFWLEATTQIHQHAFCGAFQVLHGSSIHSHYDFDRYDSINIFTQLGDINLLSCELLQVGQIRRILDGKAFIHALFHLDYPSATIVVRTHKSPLSLPQFAYHKPALAIDPFFEEANFTKKLQTIMLLMRAKHPEADKYIADWLKIADIQTAYLLLANIKLFNQNKLTELFQLSGSQDRFNDFLKIVQLKHGERAASLPAVFAEQERQLFLTNRRAFISESNHRFFLALLLNVTGKDRIFQLVQKRFPEQNALDTVLDWVYELSNTRIVGEQMINALGIEDFNDDDLFVLENLLNNASLDEVRQNLSANYPPDYSKRILSNWQTKSEKLKNSHVFQSLLA